MTLVQYGQGNGKYRFYRWCYEDHLDGSYFPKVMCGGKPYPKPVMDEQYHHTLLADMPYLDGGGGGGVGGGGGGEAGPGWGERNEGQGR